MDQYKDNPNAPRVRFIRKNGRVIPIIQGDRKGVKPRVASSIVDSQISAMSESVKNAEAGKRIVTGYGTSQHVIGTKSTFPKFYGELGFKNKHHFFATLQKPGVKQDQLMSAAVKDIKSGKDYGLGLPNRSKQFQVATREIFDNTNVIFRKLNGRVVPMKIKGSNNKIKKTVSDWDFDL